MGQRRGARAAEIAGGRSKGGRGACCGSRAATAGGGVGACEKGGVGCQEDGRRILEAEALQGYHSSPKGICGVPTLPLHTAIEDGEVELVQALLRCGADPEQKASGKSAMQVAERCNKKGSHDLVVTA